MDSSLHCLLRRIWAVGHAFPFSLLGACNSLTLPSQKESEPQLPEPKVTVAFRVLVIGTLAWVGDSWGPYQPVPLGPFVCCPSSAFIQQT